MTDHGKAEAEGEHRQASVQFPGHSKVSYETTSGGSRIHLAGSWRPPRMVTAQRLWAATSGIQLSPLWKSFFSDSHSEPLLSIYNDCSSSFCHAPLSWSCLHFLSNFPVGTERLRGCPYGHPKSPLPQGEQAQLSLGRCSSPHHLSGPLLSSLQLIDVILVPGGPAWNFLCLGCRQRPATITLTALGFILCLITGTVKLCFTFSFVKMSQRKLYWMCLEQIVLVCYHLLDFGNIRFFF